MDDYQNAKFLSPALFPEERAKMALIFCRKLAKYQ